MSDGLGLFLGKDKPDRETGWCMYQTALDYNNSINLPETVKANENFYIGKQWEGVQSNGLPTPQFNVLKRVTGFTVASMCSDSLCISASPLAAWPKEEGDKDPVDPVLVINREFESIGERVSLPTLSKEKARDAAVRGDGCTFTWFDADAETGMKTKNGTKIKGVIRTETVENTRVHFGNPNDRRVQEQPWIMLSKRESVRKAKIRAKENGEEDWEQIIGDDETQTSVDSVKRTDDKVTTIQLFWRNEETGEIWCYEFCHACEIKAPWSLGIRLYPFTWLNWDYVSDCYHGQAMITGLIPNQIFINKAWAMSMLSLMRSAWPKFVYDRTRINHLDNRIGGQIGVAGNVEGAIKILDPAQVSPQVFQFINAAIEQTEESLGATAAALGEGKAYNTSAILSLQRAASTPTEQTKQNLYKQVEDLGRIYLEFMAEDYGERPVTIPITDEIRQVHEQANALAEEVGGKPQEIPDEVTVNFDFKMLKTHPMSIRLDVGASSYYSEMASLQTLDNLLLNNRISTVQYLERIPNSNIADRQGLIEDLKRQEEQERQAAAFAQAQQLMAQRTQPPEQEAPKEPETPKGQTQEIAETPAREEQHSTGFKELGKALRSIGGR